MIGLITSPLVARNLVGRHEVGLKAYNCGFEHGCRRKRGNPLRKIRGEACKNQRHEVGVVHLRDRGGGRGRDPHRLPRRG